jgi:hypothetical protein
MNRVIKLGAVAAVVALGGVVGIALVPATTPAGAGALASAVPSPVAIAAPTLAPSPSPASQGIPASGIGSAALPAGRYHVKHNPLRGYGETLGMWRVSFDVPAGWLGENERYALIRKGYGGSPSGLVMAVRRIGRAYYDPCRTVGAEARGDYVDFPDVTYSGTVLGHLDRALARLGGQWGNDASSPPSTGFAPDSPTATKATDITIAGLAGRYVEVRTPADLDLSSCDGYQYVLWRDFIGEEPGGRLYAASPGQVDRLWIVDLDGADPQTRGLLLVIAASSQAGASAEDLAELKAIVESIEIEYETSS